MYLTVWSLESDYLTGIRRCALLECVTAVGFRASKAQAWPSGSLPAVCGSRYRTIKLLLQYHIWLAYSYASCHDVNRLNLWTACKPQLNIFLSKRYCGCGVSSASNRILAKTDTVSTVLSTLPFIIINDSLDHEVGGTLRISSRSKEVFSGAKASSFLVFFISSMTLKSCEKCFVH